LVPSKIQAHFVGSPVDPSVNTTVSWLPRRLGPGSSKPSELSSSGEFDYNFEQPGEIIFETSLEFRRNLFGFIDGALFLDAGNVWAFSDLGNEGALFEIDDFYNEIAVGTGLGLRFDFSFLIIRTDFAFKLFDPAQDLGQRWVGDQINLNLNSNFGPVLNIGIGYPF
jgi:outer membrane protein insertion porin family